MTTRADHHAQLVEGLNNSTGEAYADRVGFRIAEVVRMTRTSRPTVSRWIASGALKSVVIGTVRLIPRSELVRHGLLET
jgi:excisionase family DNA binding protein